MSHFLAGVYCAPPSICSHIVNLSYTPELLSKGTPSTKWNMRYVACGCGALVNVVMSAPRLAHQKVALKYDSPGCVLLNARYAIDEDLADDDKDDVDEPCSCASENLLA